MSTSFSEYRDSINRSLGDWPQLSWLNRLLQTRKPVDEDATLGKIFELIGDRCVGSRTYKSAADFSQALDVERNDSQLRIVMIGHGRSWDVDRDMIDVVCSKYDVDPRFLVKHFDYPTVQWEKNCPGDISSGINDVNNDYYKNTYTWDLGGEVLSPLSIQSGSCFFFAYDDQCLSLAIHEEDHRVTLLLFLRGCTQSFVETSPIFFHSPNARATRSRLLKCRAADNIFDLTSQTLSALDFPEAQRGYHCSIARAVLPYIANLVNFCIVKYHREIAPQGLKILDLYRADPKMLFSEIRQLLALQRELERFVAMSAKNTPSAESGLNSGQQILRLLDQMTEDYKGLLAHYQADDRSTESNYLADLIQAQVDEAKEAKKTSIRTGRLSQLAYIFLPLQLTAAAMGMNLKDFGTGNIELSTFVLVFAIVATLSFSPMFFPLIYLQWKDRLLQIRNVNRYSRRASLLYGCFCLFHRKKTNDQLWGCGMGHDVDFFQEGFRSGVKRDISAEGYQWWAQGRADISSTLRSPPFVFFPRFWQGVLDQLYTIIDTPQWGRKDTTHHTA